MPRVLLVDDDPTMLKLLEVNFALEGFEVGTARSGEEALTQVVGTRPDIVILDLTLPGIDGREVARRLAAVPETSGIAVVFLTGRSPGDDDGRGAATGVPYVTKPFDPADLVSLARRLVDGSS